MTRKLPLLVHLVFHPESEEGRAIAHFLHRELNDDPIVPGLRVPTVFCAENGGQPPASQNLDRADRSFVIPLADNKLNNADDWCTFVANIWEECQGSDHRCIPVQLAEYAWPLDQRLEGVNFVRAFAAPENNRNAFILRRIVIELCRYLHGDQIGDDSPNPPTKMFICHTKLDVEKEPKVIQELGRFLNQEQPIKTWFDSGDIPGGSVFSREIAKGVEDSSLLCVLTDNFAGREWCRKEILLAKEIQRPIVVIDALTTQETRSFPYLGNLPVIRWAGRPEDAIDLLLKETLRFLYDEIILNSLVEIGELVFTRIPELVTVVGLPAGTKILYPDPPFGVAERNILAKTGIIASTPLERLTESRPLEGRKIALSMSESTDIRRFGLDALHLEAFMLDLNRYLLLKGATLVYGGHLGSEGFTVKLTELVRTHNQREGVDPIERIVNYIGWPLPFDDELKAKYKFDAKLIRVPRPDGVDERLSPELIADPSFFPGDKSPRHRYAWGRGMTAMRIAETEAVSARIVLGGTFGPTDKISPDGSRTETWYFGRIPGLLEELLLSAKAGQPVFLIGAFGGVASLVIDVLEGVDRPEMTWEYQSKAPYAREMRDIYQEQGDPWWDYPEMVEFIRDKGIGGFNSLLSEEEHRELFYATDIFRIVQIILQGLDRA